MKTLSELRDTYGAGNVYSGYRTILKGGVLRFDKDLYYHPDIEGLEGFRVFVRMNYRTMDQWGSELVDVFYHHFDKKEICIAKRKEKKPTKN